MKINKLKISHWIALFTSTVLVFISVLMRFFVYRYRNKKNVVFYGHKLNGNIKPILNSLVSNPDASLSSYFLTLDKDYYVTLRQGGVNVLYLCDFNVVKALSMAEVIVTDHGLHGLILLKYLTDIKFVDVWHGIPFKGFLPNDFLLQHSYEEVWVASNYVKSLYVSKFGFDDKKVYATGYARTDILINRNVETKALKLKYGINDHTKKIVLFAPTWSQDEKGRNVFPFGESGDEFIKYLIRICEDNSALCILRTHLNTSFKHTVTHPDLYFIPSDIYPQSEELLLISDIMVCDWSSIAFDYLLLKRPTIFINIPPPFKNGLSIPASFRYGHVIDSAAELFESISVYLQSPQVYFDEYEDKVNSITNKVYDFYPDGNATIRCYERLQKMLS